MAEEKEMNEEEMVEEEGAEEMEEEATPVKETVMEAVEACFAEGGDAADLEGDAAIDAVIAKLEASKTGGGEGEGFPGLGNTGGPMDIGEPVA